MPAILELQHVTKAFPGHTAVDNVTLSIERGSFFSLVGPSGCGKTTTLRMVAGFEQATSGQILLNGARIKHLKPYERPVTTVFQSYALFPHLTVQGNVEFGLKRRGIKDGAQRIGEALELVHLAGKEKRLPAQLSGGEKQRVALARALVLQPDVLLLDEPLSALDPQLRKQVRGELKFLQRKTGITFLFVTHDQDEALSLSDHLAVMRGGRVVQAGTPRELYEQPATRFVAEFLGPLTWIDDVSVRPAQIQVSAEEPPPTLRSRPATITNVTYLGSTEQIEARTDSGASITAEVSAGARHAIGDRVWLSWQPGDEMRFPGETA